MVLIDSPYNRLLIKYGNPHDDTWKKKLTKNMLRNMSHTRNGRRHCPYVTLVAYGQATIPIRKEHQTGKYPYWCPLQSKWHNRHLALQPFP